ncbi:hypothetical protein SUS17_415 [Sphingomonas sp. S17]|uniref:Fe-S oxidoreductase n=2 Tax=Sphingomonas paucimobilis TaxID=13689 RepID=A0A411LFH1_SPHPI|nr:MULTISPECIES: hypothetical protein [Sphingomonas]RZI37718.1 hypothetical protein EGT07_37870 [Herbaspirillum sp. HC18]EGI56867.1 hypothetical protein SUS17_415 [Sphingomonas sp. S17]MBQ1479901.1 hypothetical protein [Sphingomonas sp.]MCM3679198.1 hypothetical protein [Sphingomonas paucimobilis]MDG5971952.1 hypothetical protein [Sphingomonas paucimobilis]
MKLVFLAATALIAAPVFAQDTTQADAAAQTQAQGQASTTTSTTDGTMSAQAGMSASAGTETAGGYQPAQPALAGTPQAGAPIVFKQAPSPEQAFPPPAARESYPICKKGQYDQCRQRGGK